jgi:prepilin-type N-terminal cleavage/methylation domain-containing protein
MTLCAQNLRQRGFTLIELMLALSLMGLLTATSVAAWRVGVSAQEKVSQITTANRRRSSVAEFFVAQIGAIVPMRMRSNQGTRGLSFAGTPSSMMLVSRYSLAQRTRSGLVLAMYKIEKNEGKETLMYSERIISSQRDLDQLLAGITSEGQSLTGQELTAVSRDNRWITMIENLDDGYFEYFGKVQLDKESIWERTWDSSSGRLPQGVALHFSSSEAPGRELPSTITAEVNSFENRDRPRPLYLF